MFLYKNVSTDTHYLAQRVDSQIPGTNEAYQELLKRQPKTYRIHLDWVKSFHPEEVRLAMIAIRRNEQGKLEEFKGRLTEAKLQLAGRIITKS